MRLHEIFNDTYDLVSIRQNKDVAVFSFYTDHSKYVVTFNRITDDSWDVEFYKETRGEHGIETSFHITNTGDQFKILSTVVKAMIEFKRTHHNEKLIFHIDDDEPSRVKLYKRMYDALTKKYNIHDIEYKLGVFS